MKTIQVGLGAFTSEATAGQHWNAFAVACAVFTIPALILLFFHATLAFWRFDS